MNYFLQYTLAACDMCLQVYGEDHILSGELCKKVAIMYEENDKDLKSACIYYQRSLKVYDMVSTSLTYNFIFRLIIIIIVIVFVTLKRDPLFLFSSEHNLIYECYFFKIFSGNIGQAFNIFIEILF